METKQLNGFKIEFYSKEEWNNYSLRVIFDNPKMNIPFPAYIMMLKLSNLYEYIGLVSDISEELAEKIVDKHQYDQIDRFGNLLVMYKDYEFEKVNNEELFDMDFAKQSFQTLSDLKYCVITKMK